MMDKKKITIFILLFTVSLWIPLLAFEQLNFSFKETKISEEESFYMKYENIINKSIVDLQPKIDMGVKNIIAKSIMKNSYEKNISPILITSIIFVESGFNQMSVSKAGAIGLMQIMYNIWKEEDELNHIKSREDLFQINNNILAGINVLNKMLNQNGGDIEKALYSYLGKEHKEYYEKIMITVSKISITFIHGGGENG